MLSAEVLFSKRFDGMHYTDITMEAIIKFAEDYAEQFRSRIIDIQQVQTGWIEFNAASRFKKDAEIEIKFKSGYVCNFNDKNWPWDIVTHYRIIGSEIPQTNENFENLAEYDAKSTERLK